MVESLNEAPKFTMAEGSRNGDHLVFTWLNFHDDVSENQAVELATKGKIHCLPVLDWHQEILKRPQ